MKNWSVPSRDVKPDTPKFPTSDVAHDMATAVLEAKKRKNKDKGRKLLGVDLEV